MIEIRKMHILIIFLIFPQLIMSANLGRKPQCKDILQSENFEKWTNSDSELNSIFYHIFKTGCLVCALPECDYYSPECKKKVAVLGKMPMYNNILEFGVSGKYLPEDALVKLHMSKSCHFKIHILSNKPMNVVIMQLKECPKPNGDCYIERYALAFDAELNNKNCFYFAVAIFKKNKLHVASSSECNKFASANFNKSNFFQIQNKNCYFEEGQTKPEVEFRFQEDSMRMIDGVPVIFPCSSGGFAVDPKTGRFVIDDICWKMFNESKSNEDVGINFLIKYIYKRNENLIFPKRDYRSYAEFRPIFIDADGKAKDRESMTPVDEPNTIKGKSKRLTCVYDETLTEGPLPLTTEETTLEVTSEITSEITLKITSKASTEKKSTKLVIITESTSKITSQATSTTTQKPSTMPIISDSTSTPDTTTSTTQQSEFNIISEPYNRYQTSISEFVMSSTTSPTNKVKRYSCEEIISRMKKVKSTNLTKETQIPYYQTKSFKGCFVCAKIQRQNMAIFSLPVYYKLFEFGLSGLYFPEEGTVIVDISRNCLIMIKILLEADKVFIMMGECERTTRSECKALPVIGNSNKIIFDNSYCIHVGLALHDPTKIYYSFTFECGMFASSQFKETVFVSFTKTGCLNRNPQITVATFELMQSNRNYLDGIPIILPCSSGGYNVNPETGRFSVRQTCDDMVWENLVDKANTSGIHFVMKNIFKSNGHLLFKRREEVDTLYPNPIYIKANGEAYTYQELFPKVVLNPDIENFRQKCLLQTETGNVVVTPQDKKQKEFNINGSCGITISTLIFIKVFLIIIFFHNLKIILNKLNIFM